MFKRNCKMREQIQTLTDVCNGLVERLDKLEERMQDAEDTLRNPEVAEIIEQAERDARKFAEGLSNILKF